MSPAERKIAQRMWPPFFAEMYAAEGELYIIAGPFFDE